MCLFCKIKHSFTLCLSTLYLSLVPKRSVIYLSAFCEGIYQIPMLYPRKLFKFYETIVCESVEFSGKHSFILYSSLDPYWRTERQTENRIHSLRVGWRNFFPVVLLCQFFGCGGNSFRWYLPTIPVVPLCLFFLRRENVFGCTGLFFCCGGK